MKIPDQIAPYLNEEKKMDAIEKNEAMQPILQILKESAEKFHSLGEEAKLMLHEKNDAEFFRQKLEERAQILIMLPNLLSYKLEGISSEAKQRIRERQ